MCHKMSGYLSRRALSAVCIGTGICIGSFAQRSWLQKHSYKHENDFIFPTEPSPAREGILAKEALLSCLSQVNAKTVPSGSLTTLKSEMTRFAVPSMDSMIPYDDFVVHYDRRTRNANWVFEHLTRERIKASEEATREKSQFHEDLSVHPFFRSANSDFKGSGYDRGHLAAAGNHRWGQKAMDQTFALSNISPQVGKGFNRHGWNTLEKFTRQLTKIYPNLYVVTGPLYLPRREADGKAYVKFEVIGENNVGVPTHFFKVIVMVTSSGELDLLSFVLPNQALPEKVNVNDYLVPINTIERAAGFLFFDSIPRERFRKVNGIPKIK